MIAADMGHSIVAKTYVTPYLRVSVVTQEDGGS